MNGFFRVWNFSMLNKWDAKLVLKALISKNVISEQLVLEFWCHMFRLGISKTFLQYLARFNVSCVSVNNCVCQTRGFQINFASLMFDLSMKFDRKRKAKEARWIVLIIFCKSSDVSSRFTVRWTSLYYSYFWSSWQLYTASH